MAIPVGPTTATFMVSIAALGGCGYWWQCGLNREVESPYELPKVSAEIDHTLDFISDEVDLDGASLESVVDQPSSDTVSEEAHLVEVTSEGDIEQSFPEIPKPEVQEDQDLDTISEEAHLADVTLDADVEQSFFEMPKSDTQKDQHLDTISAEADLVEATSLEGDVEQSSSEIPDFNAQENHAEESDAATEGASETSFETEYHVEGVPLEERIITDTQETDATMEVESETPSETDHQADDMQSEENLIAPEVAPDEVHQEKREEVASPLSAETTSNMDDDAAIIDIDAEQINLEEPNANMMEHSEPSLAASYSQEQTKAEVETSPPISSRVFGATDSIIQTLGLALPLGFGLALLCDAVLFLALMRCFVKMRKWFFGTSKNVFPHIVEDVPITVTAPKFCKAKQPPLDEPVADIVEEPTPKIDTELQTQVNLIVQSHAEFRKLQTECHVEAVAQEALHAAKERRLSLSASKQDPPWSSPKELASPSPAKSLSNIELNYIAHMSLSAAKERNTPAKSPYAFYDVAPCSIQWDAYEEGVQSAPSISRNLQSRFDDDDEDRADNKAENEIAAQTDQVESETSLDAKEKEKADEVEQEVSMDAKESKNEDEPTFDVTQIPSPCRRRARAALAKSDDFFLGGQTPKTKEEMPETVADTPSEHAQNTDWKSQDNQLQASPGTNAKPKAIRKTQYQCSPHSWQRQQAWTTVANAAASDKGLTPSREHKLANRRAKAFEAWGVASPDQYDFSFQ